MFAKYLREHSKCGRIGKQKHCDLYSQIIDLLLTNVVDRNLQTSLSPFLSIWIRPERGASETRLVIFGVQPDFVWGGLTYKRHFPKRLQYY